MHQCQIRGLGCNPSAGCRGGGSPSGGVLGWEPQRPCGPSSRRYMQVGCLQGAPPLHPAGELRWFPRPLRQRTPVARTTPVVMPPLRGASASDDTLCARLHTSIHNAASFARCQRFGIPEACAPNAAHRTTQNVGFGAKAPAGVLGWEPQRPCGLSKLA